MKRKKMFMADKLFKKIIDEATTIPVLSTLTITGLGEPLLDKNIVKRIAYARKKLKLLPISLFTNGTKLTPDMSKKLCNAGLTTLYVSLNAANAEKRNLIMGVDDYDKVVDYCRKAIEIGGDKMKVIVKAVVSKDLMESGERESFIQQWGGDEVLGGNAFIHNEGNWGGYTLQIRVPHREACHRAISQIMVLADGRMSLCCFDGEGDVIFGDLNKQTIRECYNSPKALGYREAHMDGNGGRRKLLLCKDCTTI
jgi:hypothetical protein